MLLADSLCLSARTDTTYLRRALSPPLYHYPFLYEVWHGKSFKGNHLISRAYEYWPQAHRLVTMGRHYNF